MSQVEEQRKPGWQIVVSGHSEESKARVMAALIDLLPPVIEVAVVNGPEGLRSGSKVKGTLQ